MLIKTRILKAKRLPVLCGAFQVMCLPFIVMNPIVTDITTTSDAWLGTLDKEYSGLWVDLLIAMVNIQLCWRQCAIHFVCALRDACACKI